MNLQNDAVIATEATIENTVVESAVAETTSTEVAAKKVYTTPFKTRGQWFKEMRESGQLAPRQPKAAGDKSAKKAAKKVADDKAAARKEIGRRRFFVNRARAAKAAAEASGAPVAPKKVYDTPYLTRGAWFKMMRETGQMAPRPSKTQVAETVAA